MGYRRMPKLTEAKSLWFSLGLEKNLKIGADLRFFSCPSVGRNSPQRLWRSSEENGHNSRQTGYPKDSEGDSVIVGSVKNQTCNGWAESSPQLGKQSGKTDYRAKGNHAETIADQKRLHHNNSAHSQTEGKGPQIKHRHLVESGHKKNGYPLD